MILIGFMHYRKKPEGLNKAYAFAAVAKAEGAELLFFSPGAVDFRNKKINGYIYKDGEWIKALSGFPDVICNVNVLPKEKQNETADKLSREIPFTSHSIGSKTTVYDNIIKYKEFANYLVPSEKVLSEKHFFGFMDKYGEIIFKPSEGHQGIDVYYISKENGSFIIRLGSEKTNYDLSGLSDFISDKINKEDYIVQPYINCRTKAGNSYDFRLHVQKHKKGEWCVGKIYPRIAEPGSIICNICSGGCTGELNAFLKREFGDNHYNIKKYIEGFSLQLAAHMDKIQKELYKEELDELGIDIGLDANQKICIYEINWRPGYPPAMNADLNTVKNIIHYAMFLADKNKHRITNMNMIY